MPILTSKLIVSLIDQVSAPARRVQAVMKGFSGLDRKISWGGRVMEDVKGIAKATREWGHAAGAQAAILTALGGNAVYHFQKIGNTLQAVTGMTDAQRKSMEATIQLLNSDFPFTNAQIASAALELGRAGLKLEQIKGSLRDTLTLSLAGDLDLGQAADIATNVMIAMRMPMETAEQSASSLKRIVDILVTAANSSNTTVSLMGETFKYVAPMIAASAGMSIEQVAAMAMALANNGIKGSEAGVALRSAIVRMVKPTKGMLATMERLNLSLDDFVIKGREISANDIIGSLRTEGIDVEPLRQHLGSMLKDSMLRQSPARLVQALTTLISDSLGEVSIVDKTKLSQTLTEAITSSASEVDLVGFLRVLREKGIELGDIMNIFDARQGSRLASLLASDLNAAIDQVEAQAKGAGDRVAETMQKGIVGAWARFVVGAENIANVMANSGALESITNAFNRMASALNTLSQSNPVLLKFATYGILSTAALLPIGMAASMAGAGLRLLASALCLILTLTAAPMLAGLRVIPGLLSSLRSAVVGATMLSTIGEGGILST